MEITKKIKDKVVFYLFHELKKAWSIAGRVCKKNSLTAWNKIRQIRIVANQISG